MGLIPLPPVPHTRPSYLSLRVWKNLQNELVELKSSRDRLQATIQPPDFFTSIAWQALWNGFREAYRRHAYDRALLETGRTAARKRSIKIAHSGEIPAILNWANLPPYPEPVSDEQKLRIIYLIYCTTTNQFYVGQTIQGLARLRQHSADLRAQRHSRQLMQHTWERYARFFVARILEYVPPNQDLSEREAHWLNALQAYTHGFNGDIDLSGLRPREFISPLLTQFSVALI